MSIASEISRLQQAKADIKTSIENKGVTVPSATLISGYSTLIDQISQGTTEAAFNDVNFYDYDGTRVYSYSKSDFANLTAMPANPTHEGLTAQGWNWTFADAQSYIASMGVLDIGMQYITSDNATRIYIHLEKRLQPYCCFAVNGTATINWGDNTSDNVVGTSVSTLITTQHTYAKGGDYVISISSSSPIYITSSGNMGCALLSNNKSYYDQNYMYINAITKVELGNVVLGQSAFVRCSNLISITIPSSLDMSGNYLFRYNNSLKYITISSSTTTLAQYFFDQSYSLEYVSLPKNVATINTASFQNCQSLRRICVPANAGLSTQCFNGCYALSWLKLKDITFITSSQKHFANCYGIILYDFTLCTSVPTLVNVNVFENIVSDCKIVVPDSLYNSWIGTTNWSNFTSYIIKESDYND